MAELKWVTLKKKFSLHKVATEGLFSFDHSDEHQEVSIGSVEKETTANKKKASKRDIIVVDDKDLSAGQEQWENPKKH